MKELEIARDAARAGGDIIAQLFARGDVQQIEKGESYNLVSEADLRSEKAIVEVIRAEFPDHAMLGEETHKDDISAEHLWIIDPLDGTNNFAHQIPHFAVSIAYYRRSEAICGVVYNPVRDEWYEADRGSGARRDGKAIRVSDASRLQEILVGTGFYYDRGEMMEKTLAAIRDLFRANIHGMRRFGTASLDLAMVATGAFGAFFEYQLAPWDYAAGKLIIEEAGGCYTDLSGEAAVSQSAVASNGAVHDELMASVRNR